jgi:hypothetical protein
MSGITQQFLDDVSKVAFSNADEINAYFPEDYIDWFQANIAKKQEWKDLAINNVIIAKTNFQKIWDNIPILFANSTCNLIQFLTLMSVIIHETGGEVAPVTERFGNAQHKKIAYLFDTIPGVKSSYNKNVSNRSAYALFNDDVYISAHQELALGSKLAKTTDVRWKGDVYPSDYSVSPKLEDTGFILQADFFKFRGRGLIQTTLRANYLRLVDYVKSVDHDNDLLNEYKSKWQDLTDDDAASTSTFADWDELFQNTDLIIACEAIHRHNVTSGNYLQLPLTATVLNGQGQGSIYRAGLKINGGSAYAQQLYRRVVQIVNQL